MKFNNKYYKEIKYHDTMKGKKDWFELIAYIVGIGAIIFTVIMILVMVLR